MNGGGFPSEPSGIHAYSVESTAEVRGSTLWFIR
jgi:hypothetical protein